MNDDSDVSEYVDDSDRQPIGRKAKPKDVKSGKTHSRHVSIKRETSRALSAEREIPDGNVKAAPPKVKREIIRSYRDLLNANIAAVLEPAKTFESDALPPSQIGTSFWTTDEKHRLFAAIQSHGPGDLLAHATAVGTKAEPEIKAYILLLQEGVRELDAKATQQFGHAEFAAAVETKPDLMEAEELLATVIGDRARAAEEAKEKQRWGEGSWLIDEDAAAAIEERYGGLDARTTNTSDVEEDQHEATHSASKEETSNSRPPLSTELLKAATLLQLSRSLFMNSIDPEMNWQTLSKEGESEQRPSIRRTAFDDFYNLVVSLTRRLMQASLFQAMSRLRATSDPRLLPHVNGFDVAAARDTMGLRAQRPEYWVDAAKRCNVEVYSDSKKLKAQEGRQGTKNGVKLTQDELRAELGAVLSDATAPTGNISDIEEDTESLDSDAYTLASSSGSSEGDSSGAEVTLDARGRTLTYRRRPLSPASFNRAETKYLERIDRHNAQAFDDEYRHILDLPATVHKHTNKPVFPYKQVDVEARPADWRAVVHYEAPWEQPQGMPQKRDFDAIEMEMESVRGRKRQRLRARVSDVDVSDQANGSPDDATELVEEDEGDVSTTPEESGSDGESENEGHHNREGESRSASEAE